MFCYFNATKMVAAIPFFAAVLCFVGFCCFQNLRREREQHLLNLRSARADFVLGDMQMIHSEGPDLSLQLFSDIAWLHPNQSMEQAVVPQN
jgi:hypothetical protein